MPNLELYREGFKTNMNDLSQLENAPRLPTGEARKLGQLANEKWREQLVLFSQIQNTVLTTNPNVHTPLKLEEGKPSPIGLFAETVFYREPAEIPSGSIALETLPKHGRTALLGRVLFSDKEGNLYRDIDLKGIGYVTTPDLRYSFDRATVSQPGGNYSRGGRWGLLDREVALLDYQNGEDLINAGIRTVRTLAIIKLEELIVGKNKISLKEARRKGIIDEVFTPVVQVRAYGTRARIDDLLDYHRLQWIKGNGLPISDLLAYEQTSDLLLEDAKKIVAQEMGKETISNDEYLEWFAAILGRNLGLIHKQGWIHGGFGDQNITLDCRFVDFDTVSDINKEDYQVEMESATENVLTELAERVLKTDHPDIINSLKESFHASYNSVLTSAERKRLERLLKQ